MMVAMGVLEQIPGHLVHDGNPYSRLINAQYGRYAPTPYAVPVNTGYYNSLGYDRYQGRGLNPYTRNYRSPYGYDGGFSNWGSPWGGNQWGGGQWGGDPWGSHWGGDPWGSHRGGHPWGSQQWASPWNTTRGNSWDSAYGNQLNTPWSSLWGNRLNSPWASTWNNPWNYPGGSAGNNLWMSPLSNSIVNPFVNPMSGAGTWSGVPGYSTTPSIPGYTPGYTTGTQGAIPGYTPGYTTGTQGAIPGYTPGTLGTIPGYTPGTQGAIPGYTPGTQGTIPGYTPGMQGYRPGNTSANSYGNSGASYFADDNKAVKAPYGPDQSRINSFGINNIAYSGSSGDARKPMPGSDRSAIGKLNRRLDGLWIGERGEMLGVRGDSFLWYDGKERYANGKLLMTSTMLKVTPAGTRREFSMHYRLVDNELYTVSRNGKMRAFNRTPLIQQTHLAGELYASPSSYNTGSTSSFVNRSEFGSDNASDSGTGSVFTDTEQQANGRGSALKLYWGEKSPMWSPNASAASIKDDTEATELPPARQHRHAADEHAAYSVEGADTFFVETTPVSGAGAIWKSSSEEMPGFTDFATSKPATRPSQSQRYARPLAQFRQQHNQAVASVNQSGTNSDRWKPLTPFSAPLAVMNPAATVEGDLSLSSASASGIEADAPSWKTAGRSSSFWSQGAESSVERHDPSLYLYSYFKLPVTSITAATARAPKIGNIWSPSASYSDKAKAGFEKSAAIKNQSSNIWKQNPSFADNQRNITATNTYYSAAKNAPDATMLANSRVKKFVWAENRGWE